MKKTKIKPVFIDERGDIADIFYNRQINHVAAINSKKGVMRGDHYHKATTQHIYLTKGRLKYYYRRLNEPIKNVKSIIVNAGEMITTRPFEVHALEILEDNQFIVFSEGKRGGKDYESDTFRIKPSLIRREREIENESLISHSH